MLWTDASSREFIAENYSWFLDTFDNYTYPIQRADAIRYFILYHYGGIYLDLDVGCLRPLDPLLVYPVILPKTIPVGVSNDLMFSEKGHEFLAQTIHNLIIFDHSWILNYPTVMFSTGPMFISAQYGLYTSSHVFSPTNGVRILPKSLYGKNAKPGEAPHSFFSHYYGSSWHADDAAFIGFLGTWGKLLMWIGLVVLVAGIVRLLLKNNKQRAPGLRNYGGYDIILPRLSQRNGRWYLDMGRLSLSAPGSFNQNPSPESSRPVSPLEEQISVLHLPFDVQSSPPPSATIPSSESSAVHPILDAVRWMRNRALSSISDRREAGDPPRASSRSRRQRVSRGVMFFLPAIFTQSQDMELPSYRSPPQPFSRTVPRVSSLPPEKQRYAQELERAGLLGENLGEESLDEAFMNTDVLGRPANISRNAHSRNTSRSTSRSASRNS
jgi:hypothetical protein